MSLRGDHGGNGRPYCVCHVAFVATAVTFILLTRGPVARPVVLPVSGCNHHGIPHVGTTHDLMDQTLRRRGDSRQIPFTTTALIRSKLCWNFFLLICPASISELPTSTLPQAQETANRPTHVLEINHFFPHLEAPLRSSTKQSGSETGRIRGRGTSSLAFGPLQIENAG